MKFLVVGVGAIGSVYLAFLTRKGHEAFGLLKPGRKLEKVRVSGIWGSFEVDVNTTESLEELPWEPDVIILSVKSYDTEEALKKLSVYVPCDSFIMIAQNGYGNYEKAVSVFGEERVILSRIIFGSKVVEQGSVEVTVCADDVVIGNPAGLIDESFLKTLAKTFSDAGIPTRYDEEVYKYLWDKIVYNCALNPLGALFEVNYGALARNPYTRHMMDEIIEETFQVMKSAGIESFWKSASEYKEVFYSKLVPSTASHFPSMLEDLRKGRTEIDALNGAVWKIGEEVGVSTPMNEFITKLIKAKEEFNRNLRRK